MRRRVPSFWCRCDVTHERLGARLELDAAQGRARRLSLRRCGPVSVLARDRVVETWQRGEALA